MTGGCSHLDSIQFVELPEIIAGCEECLASGGRWVHLRMCQSCGHIGCCDDSPSKHAIRPRPRHRTPRHPLRRAWRGLELLLRRRHHLRCQPMMCRPRRHRMRRRMSSRNKKRQAIDRGCQRADPGLLRARRATRTEKDCEQPRQIKEHAMSTIHLHQTTTATPEQFVAALTDFGPGRSKLFGNSADDYLKVHDQGPGHADVTEGSEAVWERLQYDWSDPNRVVMTTTDSNIWGGRSGHTYTFTRQPDGTTDRRCRRGARGQELQGTGARAGARDHRKGQIGRGATTNRQGYRGPERGGEGDGVRLAARTNARSSCSTAASPGLGSGPDPDHVARYIHGSRLASSDPDGNGWLLQG